MQSIANNITAVQRRVQQAACDADRIPDDVLLMAVSKTRSDHEITQAHEAGLNLFGENYLQEAVEKVTLLRDIPLEWHFIGPIQSNKTRLVATHFHWAHSVDRLKIALRLNDQRPPGLAPLNICLQVNIDNEPSKSGLSPSESIEAAKQIASLPNLRLRGLMAIPRPRDSFEEQRVPFRQLRELRDEINRTLDNSKKLDTLSMGMSNDLEAAIAEGATIVRIGTAIFGPRDINKKT